MRRFDPLYWEVAMVRLSVLVSLLLSLAIPCNATSAPLAKEAEVEPVFAYDT